jgi:hypothetical protein
MISYVAGYLIRTQKDTPAKDKMPAGDTVYSARRVDLKNLPKRTNMRSENSKPTVDTTGTFSSTTSHPSAGPQGDDMLSYPPAFKFEDTEQQTEQEPSPSSLGALSRFNTLGVAANQRGAAQHRDDTEPGPSSHAGHRYLEGNSIVS